MGKQKNIPYQGLRFFDWTDAQHFFGREGLVQSLLKRMRPDKDARRARFIGILGPSGSGKSSLARAGLLATLHAGAQSTKEGIPGSDKWPTASILQPGNSPLRSLAETIAAAETKRPSEANINKHFQSMLKSPTTLHDFARKVMDKHPASHRWVFLVDQFEEVFTLCQDAEERRAFIDNLHHAVTTADGQVCLILTARADFYGQCALDPRLNELFVQHQLLLRPMTPAELTEAMIQPALRSGCSFEADLVEILCDEVKDNPGALPLLQCALLELWRQREGRSLTKQAYLSFGGLQGVLERRAEEIFGALSEAQQELCRRLFLALVQVGQSTEDTRRKACLQDLFQATMSPRELLNVLQAFADPTVRLLTVEGPLPRLSKSDTDVDIALMGDQTFVDVSHEALITGWTRLQEWLAEHKEALHLRNKLVAATRLWAQQSDEGKISALWSGPQLALAEEWAQQHPDLLQDAPQAKAFLDTSLAHREANDAKEVHHLNETKHALQDRALLLQSKESINQKKSDYLEQHEARVSRKLRWAHAALSVAAVLLVVLTWTFVRAN